MGAVDVFVLWVTFFMLSSQTAAAERIQITDQLTFSWLIVGSEIEVTLEGEDAKWVGLGIRERAAGGMAGGDFVTCTATGEVVDWHCPEKGLSMPLVKDKMQDWILSEVSTAGSRTVCRLRRPLKPLDVYQDRSIVNDGAGVTLLFAWGSSATVSYHGSSRVARIVHLFPPPHKITVQQMMKAPDYGGSIQLLNSNHRIPNWKVEYFDICHQMPVAKDLSLIGIEAVIDPKTAHLVHHFTVYGYRGARCTGNAEEMKVKKGHNKAMLWVYNPGGSALILPDHVGIKAGGSGFHSVLIQTHFDNPKLLSGLVDNSGIRIHFTRPGEVRSVEAGVLQLGDPYVRLQRSKIPTGWSDVVFECPKKTTMKFTAPITILGQNHHMHTTGESMRTEIYRGGDKIHEVNTYYYDTHLQPFFRLNYTVHPGDAIRTTCKYYNQDPTRTFGISLVDEMCIDYALYYPRQDYLDIDGGSCGFGFNKKGIKVGEMIQKIKESTAADRGHFAVLPESFKSCPLDYKTDGEYCIR